jgi:chromosome segregation ATPase
MRRKSTELSRLKTELADLHCFSKELKMVADARWTEILELRQRCAVLLNEANAARVGEKRAETGRAEFETTIVRQKERIQELATACTDEPLKIAQLRSDLMEVEKQRDKWESRAGRLATQADTLTILVILAMQHKLPAPTDVT